MDHARKSVIHHHYGRYYTRTAGRKERGKVNAYRKAKIKVIGKKWKANRVSFIQNYTNTLI